MKRTLLAVFVSAVFAVQVFAQANPTQTQDQGADPTQSFSSPLGLGTGATLAVTEKGASVTASVERQVVTRAIDL